MGLVESGALDVDTHNGKVPKYSAFEEISFEVMVKERYAKVKADIIKPML
jgi:hypothetical protein